MSSELNDIEFILITMNAALYIHFPFCRKKCSYCDFYSVVEQPQLVAQFLKHLQLEIELYANHPIVKSLTFQTIYLGGGTPSLLLPHQLEIILNSIFKNFNFTKDIEITIEINPETIDIKKLKNFYDLGLNRLSIGVQSFDDTALKILGRIHTSQTAITCIQNAQKAGFHNINIDLIFAVPGQSLSNWENTITTALKFSLKHISMYGLTVEPGTILEQKISNGLLNRVEEATEREMYVNGAAILENSGFQQYEISNFAKPDYFSRHNQMYWNGNPYLGLGPAAHSFWNNRRQWNAADIHQYIKMLGQKILPLENDEQLTYEQQMMEFILLNLRKKSGIDLSLFKKRFKIEFQDKFKNALHTILTGDDVTLIQFDDRNLKLTLDGFLLYNEICSYFV